MDNSINVSSTTSNEVGNFTEVAIIGGGIIGTAIAYYTAKSGLECMLIEKGDIASGTSSRCEGNITTVDKDPGFDSQMSLVSQQLAAALNQELELPFEYRSPGSILVCASELEMEAAKTWVEKQRAAGAPFRMLDRSDIMQESKYWADDILGGLECATDALINPYLFCYSLIHKAREYGLKVCANTEVTSISRAEGGGFRIHTDRGVIAAKKIVNAAGVWAPFIGRMVGVEIPIVPRKGHIIVGGRSQQIMSRNVMEFGYLMNKFGGKRIVDELTEKYGVALVLEPTDNQNFLLGSSRQFAGYDGKIDMNVIHAIARRALRFFPGIADFRIIRTYTGMRPWTADHLPIVSAVDEVPGFYIAAGHEGDGISLATVTGKLIEQLIHERSETIIPFEPLRYDRFQKQGAMKNG